ncbi:hypothetical protein BDY19DRAFT_997670 [Irpex rosettiformis]|uniref:Uncharacterized protein n=1 Tax=Irpex rosettiformis TaxID=378272 RepID=A0ACB8TR43_9APHY|nr:hypothetical protein BDY19DRAFT_997670 [Irpex rosettiformis]
MAAAVLPSPKLSNVHVPDRTFHMSPSMSVEASTSRVVASSSSRPQPSASHIHPSPPVESKPSTTFSRFRTSLEQTLRTTGKSRGRQSLDGSGTITPSSPGKGKDKASDESMAAKERSKSSMLSKVSFRRPGGKEINNVSSSGQASEAGVRSEAVAKVERDRDKTKVREAGYTSFQTPSLRQASMSSPTLHLSSQPFQSPYSPFALPASSASNVAALVSPPRAKRVNARDLTISTKDISGPAPLVPRKDARSPTNAISADQKIIRGRPSQPQVPTAGPSRERASLDSTRPETPTRRARGGARSPDLSPPSPSPRSGHLAQTASRRAAANTTHLPLTTPPASPTAARPLSPSQARSSSRTPTYRAHPSASSSNLHLPLSSSPPTPATPIRRSSDNQRVNFSSSPTPGRAASPTTPVRIRAVSPTQRNYSHNLAQIRSINSSNTSLATTATSEHRELVRTASSLLIKEMLKPPAQSGLDPLVYEEVEVRLRSLARLERVWGKSGSSFMGSVTQLSAAGSGLSGLGAGGEERERRHFGEALRDGYVLCQLVNKLEPGHIPRVDRREDGFVRTSNVTKFLAACSQVGVSREELFHRDDLIESTPDSMARVAKCIIALLRVNEFPATKGKIIQGGQLQRPGNSPYGTGTLSRAASSTPNLSLQRSISPVAMSTPNGRKRISPSGPSLPTLRSDSPGDSDSDGSKTAGELGSKHETSDVEVENRFPVPKPPARSPLRPRGPSVERVSVADSTRASIGDSVRASFADSVVPSSPVRQSLAQSLASSQTTDTTAMSSLLDIRSRRSSDAQNSKFGTLRTMTTEATSFVPSENPSLSPTEAKAITSYLAEELKRPLEPPRPLFGRERRPSETAVVDLMRVVEESEEGSSSAKANKRSKTPESPVPVPRPKLQLGKGKWPDDFFSALPSNSPSPVSALGDDDEPSSSSLSVSQPSRLSASPPRKLAIVGGSRGNESIESLPQFPRRPTHRARHSVDTPGLLPKEALLRRDSSPDTSVSPNPRIMLRRSSTKTGAANRNGMYIARAECEDSPVGETSVPFPRTVSGEHSTPPQPQGVHFPPELAKVSSGAPSSSSEDRARQPRGRFQSEIDGASSRRKPRPNSYDDAGSKPGRSRFESMVNLGSPSGPTSASDLMRGDGSAVRKTLIVREDGKLATQFQLGNCIGRGQFGVVYRALNLNSGQTVAVKRIGLTGLKEEEIAQLMREVDLVKSLSHPSIVKYEGMARDDDTLSIVLEYAENGSLGQTLKAFGKLNEKLVAGYVVKILEGLHYLHQSDVVHCDLKAANILTTKTGNVKLSDFGVSLNLRAMERDMPDVAGTPNWMAPEVIELKGASTKSDIWSLACTVIELLTGRPPYGEIANTMSVMFRIVEDDMPPLPEGASELLKDFLKQCFQKDSKMRPDAEMLCEHEWLKQNWAAGKDLRPQDSIPFLRRVSMDMQKSEVIKYLAKIEMPESERESTPEITPNSPLQQRMSNDLESISPRDHSFVKTTFHKPVVCRVCQLEVKRSAVLCSHCSLIAHSKCQHNAPPTCDLRSQLLLYAQYAEGGTPVSPNSAFSSPLEGLAPFMGPASPSTPISDAGVSARNSTDSHGLLSSPPISSPPPLHPPSAFKVLGAFKRSRSFLLNKDGDSSSPARSGTASPTPSHQPHRQLSRKISLLGRHHHAPPPSVTTASERPSSIASSTASPRNSSLRSGTTNSHSKTRPETVRRQSTTISIVETDVSVGERTDRDRRLSRMTTGSFSATSMSVVNPDDAQSMDLPGDFPGASSVSTARDKRRDGAKADKSGCLVQ